MIYGRLTWYSEMRNFLSLSSIHLYKKYLYETKSFIAAHFSAGLRNVDNKKLSIDLVKTAKFSANNWTTVKRQPIFVLNIKMELSHWWNKHLHHGWEQISD